MWRIAVEAALPLPADHPDAPKEQPLGEMVDELLDVGVLLGAYGVQPFTDADVDAILRDVLPIPRDAERVERIRRLFWRKLRERGER